jgi:NAD-dependent dihydropyrimidine dehydrogenase PreA subunit
MARKGVVMDIWIREQYYYMISPFVVGFFEFTMMRTRNEPDAKKFARLFYDYMNDKEVLELNFGNGQKVSPMRVLPHEETISQVDYTEILDHERAIEIVRSTDKYAMGICSCRHEKLHVGEKKCDVPLENCISFGPSAEFMIRHDFAKPASRSEIFESLAQSKEMGLVYSCDNVKKNVGFICQCCGCCCNMLLGISRFGYANTIVTSSYIAEVKEESCEGCGKCASACPIHAIEMLNREKNALNRKKTVHINEDICIGCGVCSLKCTKTNSLKLRKRKQKVLHPESTYERIILQCLERGTLQNQIFGNPEKISQKIMKGLVGGFLRLPPVKKTLMSDKLRSRFLDAMKKGAEKQNKAFLLRT